MWITKGVERGEVVGGIPVSRLNQGTVIAELTVCNFDFRRWAEGETTCVVRNGGGQMARRALSALFSFRMRLLVNLGIISSDLS